MRERELTFFHTSPLEDEIQEMRSIHAGFGQFDQYFHCEVDQKKTCGHGSIENFDGIVFGISRIRDPLQSAAYDSPGFIDISNKIFARHVRLRKFEVAVPYVIAGSACPLQLCHIEIATARVFQRMPPQFVFPND